MQASSNPMQNSSKYMLVSNSLMQDNSRENQVSSKVMLVNTNQGTKDKAISTLCPGIRSSNRELDISQTGTYTHATIGYGTSVHIRLLHSSSH
jgi:hypothetical protein